MGAVTVKDQLAAYGILISLPIGVALIVCLIVFGLTRGKTGGES